MALLPVAEILLRAVFRVGISGVASFTQHFALVAGMLGAAVAAAAASRLPLGNAMAITAVCVVLVAAILGSPVFTTLGGVALFLFWSDGLPIASIPLDHYRLVVNPSLPMIPLFTLAGYFLAEGR